MRKPAFCTCENKDADQLRGNREADQCLCFRHTDCTIPLPPNSEIKFQVSSDLLWLHSPVFVGPGRKARRPVFSQRGSTILVSQTAPICSTYLFAIEVTQSCNSICLNMKVVHTCI